MQIPTVYKRDTKLVNEIIMASTVACKELLWKVVKCICNDHMNLNKMFSLETNQTEISLQGFISGTLHTSYSNAELFWYQIYEVSISSGSLLVYP